MTTYQIDLLNPKAARLLQDLADLELIAIRAKTESGDKFLEAVERIRKRAAGNPPSLDDITKEVELGRSLPRP